jgi:hypothetical protein
MTNTVYDLGFIPSTGWDHTDYNDYDQIPGAPNSTVTPVTTVSVSMADNGLKVKPPGGPAIVAPRVNSNSPSTISSKPGTGSKAR